MTCISRITHQPTHETLSVTQWWRWVEFALRTEHKAAIVERLRNFFARQTSPNRSYFSFDRPGNSEGRQPVHFLNVFEKTKGFW